jgi:hypothetical protein
VENNILLIVWGYCGNETRGEQNCVNWGRDDGTPWFGSEMQLGVLRGEVQE